jgi:hypothetical protein
MQISPQSELQKWEPEPKLQGAVILQGIVWDIRDNVRTIVVAEYANAKIIDKEDT